MKTYKVDSNINKLLNFTFQVDLLTTSEIFADSPDKIESNIGRILKSNPNLTEAHFLAYLNCLRVNEYTGSVWILLSL